MFAAARSASPTSMAKFARSGVGAAGSPVSSSPKRASRRAVRSDVSANPFQGKYFNKTANPNAVPPCLPTNTSESAGAGSNIQPTARSHSAILATLSVASREM